jgi:hypothetical protein
LITLRDSASYQVVMNNAFTSNTTDELNLLNNIRRRAISFPENPTNAEKLLLENPNIVFFAPELSVNMKTQHYPCLITATSTSLFKVERVGLNFNIDRKNCNPTLIKHSYNSV